MTHMPPHGGQPPNPGGQPHFDPNQPPPTQPQPTQPGPHMQQPMQSPTQPAMGAPMGGQPPMGPPPTNMGYGPHMGPPPKKGNGGKIALASVLALALVAGIGGFFLWTNVLKGGPDPAETMPASSVFYMEVNLDPNFDQTPKLLNLMNRFDDIDISEERDQAIIDLFNEHGEVDFDPDADLVSWMGNRGAVGAWFHDDEPYAVLSLASTDDSAAEEGMQNIVDSGDTNDDEVAFTVEDGSMVAVIGEENASSALESLQSEAESSPITDNDNFSEAMDWLGDDQLLTIWADTDNIPEDLMDEVFEAEGFDFEDLGSGSMVAGMRAFDDGFEMKYRGFSDEDPVLPGDDQLLERMGDLPAAPVAASISVPEDLEDRVGEYLEMFEELQEEMTVPGEEQWEDPTLGEPLTQDEYDEWEELNQEYEDDFLGMSDEDFSRWIDLDVRLELYGVEGEGTEPDSGSGAPGSELSTLMDIIAGSQINLAVGGNSATEDIAVELSANLQDGKGAELQQWMEEMQLLAPGEDAGVVDGDTYTLSEGEFSQGPLSDDSRFNDVVDSAPDNASIALWVDVNEGSTLFSGTDVNEAAPLSLVTWIHGSEDSNDSGVMRFYLDG